MSSSRRISADFGVTYLEEVGRRQAIEAQPRAAGQVLVPPTKTRWLVRFDGYAGGEGINGTYTGRMLESPFLDFVVDPDPEDPSQTKPLITTYWARIEFPPGRTALDAFAHPIVGQDGETRWWFEWIEGLPPGGLLGEAVHRDSAGVAYWTKPFTSYPEATS